MAAKKATKVKTKEPIGRSIWVNLNRAGGPGGSWVTIDGHPIHGINRLEIVASSDWRDPPQIVLHLCPENMEVTGNVDIKSVLDFASPAERFEVDLE